MNPARLRRTAAIALRYFYLLRGSPARIVPLFAWVAVDIVLWGFITRYLNDISASGLNFVPTMLGAVLLWDFFIRVMQGVTMVFFEDVWSRNFLNFFATQLTISEYVGGMVISSIVSSLVGLIVMVALAGAVFGLSFFAYGLALLPFLLVLFLFGIALGIVASAIVLRLGPASEWLIWPIPALLTPFAGVFYPLSTLPAWMQSVGRLLPPSYVFEGIRSLVHDHVISGSSMVYGVSLAVLYLLAAAGYFAATYRHTVRTGLLARYSAETVS